MKQLAKFANLIPKFCPKCGSHNSFELRDDGCGGDELVCIICGWTIYLDQYVMRMLKQILDKAKCGHQTINQRR